MTSTHTHGGVQLFSRYFGNSMSPGFTLWNIIIFVICNTSNAFPCICRESDTISNRICCSLNGTVLSKVDVFLNVCTETARYA